MVTNAVAHGFDEDGLGLGHRSLPSLDAGNVDCERIVPVDANRVDAVSDSSRGDTVTVVLLGRWGRDCESAKRDGQSSSYHGFIATDPLFYTHYGVSLLSR